MDGKPDDSKFFSIALKWGTTDSSNFGGWVREPFGWDKWNTMTITLLDGEENEMASWWLTALDLLLHRRRQPYRQPPVRHRVLETGNGRNYSHQISPKPGGLTPGGENLPRHGLQVKTSGSAGGFGVPRQKMRRGYKVSRECAQTSPFCWYNLFYSAGWCEL